MAGPPEELREPLDSDVDLTVPAQRRELEHHHLAVLGAVALGGAIGAAARYAAAVAWPTADGTFPATTMVVNIAGCALIGVLMVVVTEKQVHPLTRPFLGTGVLGGFTTFSTYVLDIEVLLKAGEAATAVAYLALTLVAALAAVWTATWATRRLIERRRP
ncbi:fluoride efflux transporter CrcB [Glycomyces sp. NPDC046736]|uniref:fluoride efflux transporter CrcB n=1 Tax=Glycomyces sp. NPDC046736 TaxID=3155615 RepID=UPI0033C305E6